MGLVFIVAKTREEIVDALDQKNVYDMMDYRFDRAYPDEIKVFGFRNSYGEYLDGRRRYPDGLYSGICRLGYEENEDGSTNVHVRTPYRFADERLTAFMAQKLDARPQIMGGIGAPP